MAENPDTWGPAEFVVDAALDAADEGFAGFSEVRQITYALEQAGLLGSCHWGQAANGIHPCRCSLGKDHVTSEITFEDKKAAVRDD